MMGWPFSLTPQWNPLEDSGGHTKPKWPTRSDLLLKETLLPDILEEVYHILLGWLLVLHNAIKSKERRDGFPIALERRASVHLWAKAEPQMVLPKPQVLAARPGYSDSVPKPPSPGTPTRPGKKSFSRSSPSPISSRSTSTSWSLFLPSASICQRSGPPATTSAGGERELESKPHP